MLKVTLSNILSHRFRSVALMLTIVLGVSFVAGTYVLTDTITKVFDDIFDEVYGDIDLSVRSESALGTDAARPPVPETLLPAVQAVPGVKVAEGGVFVVGADILGPDGDRLGNEMAPTFGLSWTTSEELSVLDLRDGSRPAGIGQVALDARSFDDGGFALGDPVRLVTPTGPREFTVVGVVTFGRASNIAGATLSVFDLPTAQEVMGREGQFDSIDVIAEDGVPAGVLQDRIAATLPAGYEAVTGTQLSDESDEAVAEGLSFFKIFLLVFAYIALFVGAFIIYNTFGIVVTQRTRELALLRALGASGRQVMTSVIAESLVLGIVASAIGLGAGVLLASGLKALLDSFDFEVPSGDLVLLPRTVIVALAGGTAVTALSAIAPAVRAARVPPIAAMQDIAPSRYAAGLRRNIAGVVLGTLGVVGVLSGLGGGSLLQVGVGALLSFLGVAMLAPLFARPVAAFVGAPVAHGRGAAGLLARQNAMRSARRTAATASALMIGTALMAGSLILSGSFTESVERAVSKGAIADLVVTTRNEAGFSPALADDLRGIAGVGQVYGYRAAEFKIGDATKEIVGLDPDAIDPANPLVALDIDVRNGAVASLEGDAIAVQRDVAADRGWSVGDEVVVTFPAGDRELTVGALFEENALTADYIVGMATFEAGFAERNDIVVLVSLADGADLRAVQADIQAVIDSGYSPQIDVQDRDQYIGDVKQQVNQFLGLITALLALAVVIALLGVLITMLLAVFERTHELGLLRAVGMARRQVRAMVRWEAAIVATYGAVLGLLLGVFFGLALTGALEDEGVTVQVVPVPNLVGLAIIIAVLGVVASIYPARRAARLNILSAIAHE
jgi:putative ABC transport system permease protein